MDYKELTVEQLREQGDILSVDIKNSNNLIAEKESESEKEHQLEYLTNNIGKYFFKHCCGEIYIFNPDVAYANCFCVGLKGVRFALSTNALSVYSTADVKYDEFLYGYDELDKETIDKILSLINIKDTFINNNIEDIYNKVSELLPQREVGRAE